jgi:hypothetical protein
MLVAPIFFFRFLHYLNSNQKAVISCIYRTNANKFSNTIYSMRQFHRVKRLFAMPSDVGYDIL